MGLQMTKESESTAPFAEPSLQMHSLSELTREKLEHLAQQQVDAGLLDLETLTPNVRLEKFPTCKGNADWQRIRIKRHVFDIPPAMKHPEFLAIGGYGCVVECMYHGQKVAVKKVAVPGRSNQDDALRLLREVIVLQAAHKEKQHSLCQLLDVYCNLDCQNAKKIKHIYMVMPLYSPGSLEEVHVSTPAMFHTIATHTLEAVHWLHSHNILHRDVKRENIFYDEARNRAVLGDMGNSRRLTRAKMTGKNEVGTKCYQAPEFLTNQQYGYASDVWSLGVCWYEMLCLEDGYDTLFPFPNAPDRQVLAMQNAWCQLLEQRPSRSKHTEWAKLMWSRVQEREVTWQESYCRIFRKVFIFDKKRRPATAGLYTDPFFAKAKPNFKVVEIPGLDTDDYDEARTHLFNMRTLESPDDVKMDVKQMYESPSTKCPSFASSQLFDELQSPSLFSLTHSSPVTSHVQRRSLLGAASTAGGNIDACSPVASHGSNTMGTKRSRIENSDNVREKFCVRKSIRLG